MTDALRQLRGGLGVGLQGGHHIHPVQRMQVIKVHHVVVHILRPDHQVADQFGVVRDLDLECILHRAHRGDAMHQRADAANALGESPGVARVAAAQDDFDAAHHGAGRVGLGDLPGLVGGCLDAQMALDPGNGVDNDALCGGHGVSLTA